MKYILLAMAVISILFNEVWSTQKKYLPGLGFTWSPNLTEIYPGNCGTGKMPQLLGFSWFTVPAESNGILSLIGLYGAWRVHGSGGFNYYSTIDEHFVNTVFHDDLIRHEYSTSTYVFGITFTISNRLAGYTGVGRTAYTTYSRYFDPLYILGGSDGYSVLHSISYKRSNEFGLLFNGEAIGKTDMYVYGQLGWCTEPKGLVMGIGFVTFMLKP